MSLDPEAPLPDGLSLADRMRRRVETIATQRTVTIPVPGYQSMLGVKMRALTVERTGSIAKNNERVRIEVMRNLYTAADLILVATEGFVEYLEDGSERELPDHYTWQYLANEVKETGNLTGRQALLSLLGDINVGILSAEWDQWLGAEKRDMDAEVSEDFGLTP